MKSVYPWFRFYTEARTDAKLEALTDAEFRVWVKLLCLAAEQYVERGTIPAMEPFLLAVEVSRGDEALAQQVVAKLVRLRIVEATEDGRWRFINFDERQYDKPSDRPEETRARKARQRERERDTHTQGQSVTPKSRHVTRNHGQEGERDREIEREVNNQGGKSECVNDALARLPAEPELIWAKTHLAHLTREQLDDQAELFRAYCERKEIPLAKMGAEWRNWVLREKTQFSPRTPAAAGRNGRRRTPAELAEMARAEQEGSG